MKPTRYYSDKQEKRVAKAVGGKQIVNSGATKFQKGDVMTPGWFIECKTTVTSKKSFTIKEEWLDKMREEGFAMGKNHQALMFDFGLNKADAFYIISAREFQTYMYLLEKEENADVEDSEEI